jgi:hypothetical protein
MDETASFWIKRAVSFKSYKTPKRVNLQSSPQLSFVPSIASLPNSNPVPIFGRVFHFGPWPLNYAIEPLIDQKLLISSIRPLNQLIPAPPFTRLFQFGPWFRIFSIKSLIGP